MSPSERFAAVAPFEGRLCRITHGRYETSVATVTATVLGASWHQTNGNSTGDLILRARDGYVWQRTPGWGGEVEVRLLSIALAVVRTIEVAD